MLYLKRKIIRVQFLVSNEDPVWEMIIGHSVTTRTKQYNFSKCLTKFDQQLVCGLKLTFSTMDNFGLIQTPFRRPRRYEFIDGLNVKIRLTDKKLWPWGVQTAAFYQCPKQSSIFT